MGPYPFVVEQASGKKVPVVQDYMFGKYLGVLHVTFDDEGEVKEWEGNPVLLNDSIQQGKILSFKLRGPTPKNIITVLSVYYPY